VQRQLGADLARQPRDPEVLHDDGVGARAGDVRQGLLGDGQLAIEDQRVEGDESLHAFRMEELEDARKVGGGEVVRARPGVEAAAQSEIDGVRAAATAALRLSSSPAGASNSGFSSTFAMGDGPGFVTAEVSRIR